MFKNSLAKIEPKSRMFSAVGVLYSGTYTGDMGSLVFAPRAWMLATVDCEGPRFVCDPQPGKFPPRRLSGSSKILLQCPDVNLGLKANNPFESSSNSCECVFTHIAHCATIPH
jgi:hypothetical protein